MIFRNVLFATCVAASASFSNFVFAAGCELSNTTVSVTPQNATEGQSVTLEYGTDRKSCSGVGSYSYKVTVGGPTSLELGRCDGVRTIAREECSAKFDLPAGFQGELNIFVNGIPTAINVAAKPKVPVVTKKLVSTIEDTPVEIELGVEGEQFPVYEIVSMKDINSGSITISGSRAVFVPAADWNGVSEIAYRALDDNGIPSADSVITIEVQSAPDKPILVQAALRGLEDEVLSFRPTVLDPDVGDTYQLVVSSQPPVEKGSVVADGVKVLFTPAPDWFGETTFTLKAVDSFGLESSPQEYTVIIENVNDAPVVAPKTLTLLEDESVTYTVPYTDFDGVAPYKVFISAQPPVSKGVCSVSGEIITFLPAKDWNGTVNCEVAVADSAGGVGRALLTYKVSPVNDVPVGKDKQITLNQSASGSVQLTVDDPDLGDTFTFSVLDPAEAAFGIVNIEGSNLTITPAPNFYGTKKLNLQVTDSSGATSQPFSVYVKVIPLNGAPVIASQTYSVQKGEPFSVQLGAIDPNSDFPLTYAIAVPVDPANGTASIVGDVLTFTPASSFVGMAAISVTAKDPGGLVSTPATFKFQVDDVVVIALDPDVPDSHTVVIVSQPPASVGVVTALGNKVTLTPVKGYFGTSAFTYKVVDSFGAESPVITGQITVGKFNYAPSSATASLVVKEGESSTPVTPVVVDENPYDAGNHKFIIPIQATTGFVEVINNKLVYTAAFGFSGVEKFKFIAVDPSGLSVVGEATVTVSPLNYAPESISGFGSGVEGSVITAAMVVKDKNPTDTFTYTILSQVLGGTASVSGGNLIFTPEPGFTGNASVPVRATDNGGLSVDGSVLFKVVLGNVAPTSLSGDIKVFENSPSAQYYPKIIDANIYDQGRHVLEVVTPGQHGSVTIVNNRIVYVPETDYSGDDLVAIKATDLAGESVVGNVTVSVVKINSAPIEAKLALYTEEGVPSVGTIPTVNDPNAWDVFTYEVISQPSHGSVVITQDGFVYTPDTAFYGSDEFNFRTVDAAGEYIEAVATVYVSRKNYSPTGFSPIAVNFYEGVGSSFKLKPIDVNLWGSHTFSIIQQPDHGSIWTNGHTLVYRTTGNTPTQAIVRVTDQDGAFFEGPITLTPRPASDLIDGLPVVDVPSGAIRTPATTTAFLRQNGMPGFVVTDADVLAALGTEWIAVLDSTSDVGIRLSGKELQPSKATRVVVDFLSSTAVGTSISALEAGKAGNAFVNLARIDGTGSVYRIPVSLWAASADISLSANPAIQLVDRVRGQLMPNSYDCAFSTSEQLSKAGNAYDNPICYVQFDQRPAEVKDTSTSTALAFQGPIETVGVQKIVASSYILTMSGGKHLVGKYEQDLEVLTATDAIKIEPKYPFTEAYYRVQDLDIEFKQSLGPVCDLTTVEYLAKSAASNYSNRPSCLVEWTEIPVGLTVRPSWDRPYLLGASQYLGANSTKWNLSIYSPTGAKVLVGTGEFDFNSILPPDVKFEYDSKSNKIGDNYFTAAISGQYIGEALISSAAAAINLRHGFNEGNIIDEELRAGFGLTMSTHRRINIARFDSLWEKRQIKAVASYKSLPDSNVESTITVVSVPDPAIAPIIDTKNQMILSTDKFNVTVGIGDSYNPLNAYTSQRMGDWDIRLITKPTWNTVEPLTDWASTDDLGKASFDVDFEALAGKTLRILAEARPKSPIPEYQTSRVSPKALSLAILNGAALDGSVRALRLTGEAPLRVTIFADVTNRSWTRDLGGVKWEIQNEGGAWEPVVNKSKSMQRLAMSFAKGKYKVRAELTNKNSGVKSMTDEIEIIAYDVPVGQLKGPRNTFIDAQATFKVLQKDGQPIDLSKIDVEWSLDRGKTWVEGSDSITETRSFEKSVYIASRMKFKDAPLDDPRIWKVLRSGVTFHKIRPPRVQLIGPTRPEVGKEAVWIANMLMPYPNMDLVINGEFIMPGSGEVVPGTKATYTPTDADLDLEKTEIQYRSWIEGYRDKGGEGLTKQKITFWNYDWPKWAIQHALSSEYAPADLTLRVRNIGEFKNVEGVYYQWEMPSMPGYTVVKDDNMSLRMLSIQEANSYPFKVHVYDARGNYSLVERSMTFLTPPPWEVNMAWSGDNNASRAPMKVMVRPYITGGHPKDTITSLVYRINGEVLDIGKSRYARASLPTEGTYAVTLDVETKMGKAVVGNIDIEVKENNPPTCELEVKEGSTSWTASAKCVDTDGRIARHHWYVEDELQGLGGSVITISKRKQPTAPHITLIAVDDSGEESPPVIW